MRKTIALLLALICLLTLAGCNQRSMNYIIANEPSITGLVKDTGDKAILIENDDGEYDIVQFACARRDTSCDNDIGVVEYLNFGDTG